MNEERQRGLDSLSAKQKSVLKTPILPSLHFLTKKTKTKPTLAPQTCPTIMKIVQALIKCASQPSLGKEAPGASFRSSLTRARAQPLG